MSNDLRLEKLTRAGIALMQEEKEAALRGDLAALAEIDARKTTFLAQMASLAEQATTTGPVALREARKREIATLFDIVRRRAEENQYLLRAASAGVKSATRQVQSLTDASAALGVYTAEGDKVRPGDADRATTRGVY